MKKTEILLWKIRATLLFFMVAMVFSGVTAFPLRWELQLLEEWTGNQTFFGETFPDWAKWIAYVREGVEYNAKNYPYMAYGTDWLAFAHLVIAVAFLGPLRDPVRNIWIVQWGLIACVSVFPLAFFGGSLRGIPPTWQGIDCSFGFFGAIPLLLVWKWTRELEQSEDLYEKAT